MEKGFGEIDKGNIVNCHLLVTIKLKWSTIALEAN